MANSDSGPKRKFSSEKYKGYYELNDKEPIFTARYLGVTNVDAPFQPERAHEISARCVDKLHKNLQDSGKKRKVSLLISTNVSRGLTLTEKGSEKEAYYALYDIAFCSTDVRDESIFSFIADCDGELQCHVFAFKNEESAKAVCMALSNAFSTAHGEWMRKQKREKARKISRQEITVSPIYA